MPSKKWILNRFHYPGEITLDGREQYSFGRHKENDHVLLSIYVSRRHCIFKSDGSNLSIIDLNSANGTYVNNCRINAHEAVTLKESDVIGFGVTTVESNDYFVFTLKGVNEPIKLESVPDNDIQEITVKKEPVTDLEKQEDLVIVKGVAVPIKQESAPDNDIQEIAIKKVPFKDLVKQEDSITVEGVAVPIKQESAPDNDIQEIPIKKEPFKDLVKQEDSVTVEGVAVPIKQESAPDIQEIPIKKAPFKDLVKQEDSVTVEDSEIELLSPKVIQPIEVIDLSDDEIGENTKSTLVVPNIEHLPCVKTLSASESSFDVTSISNAPKNNAEIICGEGFKDLEKDSEDLDEWYRTVILPYIETLDSCKQNSEEVSHGETSNNKRKSDVVISGESSKKKIKLCVNMSNEKSQVSKENKNENILNQLPIVLVERLDVNKLNKTFICDDDDEKRKRIETVGETLMEDCYNSSSSSPSDKRDDNSDLDFKSQIFNYSQSDDAVIVIDDDQDEETVKEQKTEDICIKQEIFEDEIEEEDEDDIVVIEWVSKLSQTLNIKEEKIDDYPHQEDTVASVLKTQRRILLTGDSFDDDLDSEIKDETPLHSVVCRPNTSFNENDGVIKTLIDDASTSKISLKTDVKKSGLQNITSGKNFQENFFQKPLSNKTVEFTLTENSSLVPKSNVNKKTLLCSALPLKQRRSKSDPNKIENKQSSSKKSHDNERQHGDPITQTKFSASSASKSNTYSKLKSKHKPNHKTSTGDTEKSRDKEDRKKKLRALAEKDKEKGSSSKSKTTLHAKTLVPVKNTKTSRADKLLEQFVVPQHNSVMKSSRLSTQEKSDGEIRKIHSSETELSKETRKESKSYDSSLHNSDLSSVHLDVSLQKVKSLQNQELYGKPSDSDAVASCKYSNEQVDVVQQVRKLSFKDLPKIPKRKDTSENSLHSDKVTIANVQKVGKQLQNKFAATEVQHKTLQSCLRLLGSPRKKKTVNFVADDKLCSVRSFLIDHNNKLRPVDAKDAPVNRSGVQEARCLFEVSQKAVDYTVSQILRMWNPRWLKEQKEVSKHGDIPPPCYGTNDSVSLLVPMLTSFTNYQDYIKVIRPLMLLDLWAEVSEHADRGTKRTGLKFNIAVDHTVELNGITTISCSIPLTSNEESEQIHPRAGDLCQLFYPYWDLATSAEKEKFLKQGKSPKDMLIAVFAYVDGASKDHSQKGKTYHPFEGNHAFSPGNTVILPQKVISPMSCLLKLSVKMKSIKNTSVQRTFLKLQVLSNIRPSLRMFEAVSYLEHITLCKMILHPCIEDFKLPNVNGDIKLESEDLDRSQKMAVAKAAAVCVSSSPKICMIQGPPGTGKTKVIMNIVMQILYPNGERRRTFRNKRPRILLCAPSNAGIDEIVERLLEVRRQMKKEDRFKMVRCGQFHSMRESVRGVSLEELVNKDIDRSLSQNMSLESVDIEIATQEAKKRSYIMVLENAAARGQSVDMYKKRMEETVKRINDLKNSKPGAGRRSLGMERDSRRKVLAHADIIATTLTSSFMPHLTEVFASKYGKSIKFTCCVIDEATQCKEPECLIPLMYGIDRLVMVGDPEQLPATVHSKTAREKSFGQSLFNRIWNKFQNEADNPVILLNTQYRMHPELYVWPNAYIYHGQVKSVPSLLKSGPLKPYCVFSLTFKQTSGMSLCNEREAHFVSEVAFSIASILPDLVKSVGIITPYQKQLNIIKSYIHGRPTEIPIAVSTIDGFQGQECDVIIFSCVRSHGVGFMGESQRLNVALTRARLSLIICGNFKSLQEDKMWSCLLDDAGRRGVVITTNDKELNREEILRCILKT